MTKQTKPSEMGWEEELGLLLREFYSEMSDVHNYIDKDTYDGTDFTYSDQHSDWVLDCIAEYIRKINLLIKKSKNEGQTKTTNHN